MSESALTPDDRDYLRYLSIGCYVVGGIEALAALFPVIHLVVGIGLLASGLGASARGAETMPASFVGGLFVLIAGMMIVLGMAKAVVTILAGRYLLQRRRWVFCLVVACVSCAFMPFGTVLGVFMILVLSRERVKRAFGRVPDGDEPRTF